MIHVVPILCLIFFIGYMEIQLKKEIVKIEEEFSKLDARIVRIEETIENLSMLTKWEKKDNG